jgi:glycosyltransferase involved in cell wall biosynthesis
MILKVGVWLDENYSPQAGGGFSYYNKLIRNLDEFSFHPDLEIVFISTKAIDGLNKTVLNIGSITLFSRIIKKIAKRLPYARVQFKLFEFAFRKKNEKLRKAGVDIIYYPIQALKVIPNYPFVSTNWDLGHLTTYPFPEMVREGEFIEREFWYKNQLLQALMVFAESEEGRKELIKHLNISESKVKVIPLFAGSYMKADETSQHNILHRFKLKTGKYFFYPAQFWAHKNHHNLLLAFKEICEKYSDLQIVFTGSDKGNLNYIVKLVANLNLNDRVLFLGFVSSQELFTLYSNALALVMPTLLGPTNMPLLEARELNCPIVCSNHKGHIEMLKDGAFYFDALDKDDIAIQLERIINEHERHLLLEKSRLNEKDSVFNVTIAMERIQKCFLELIPVRKTWE